MQTFSLTALVIAVMISATSPASAQSTSLNRCQATVARESGKYIRAVADSVGKCLKKISKEMLEDGEATDGVARSCVSALRRIVRSDDPSKQLANRFNQKVSKSCDPASNPSLEHGSADTYTIGQTRLSAAKLDAYCETYGDGAIGSFTEWRDCIRRAADCQARQAIAVQWPRALEYMEALESILAGLTQTYETTDALSALRVIDRALEGSPNDNVPELTCGPIGTSGGLLVTGQTSCDRGDGYPDACPGIPNGQDGATQAGTAFNYTDNGDGTITDNVTGLMWEKLSNDGSIHDVDSVYTWSDAFTVKIANLNAGSFAGHTDWRLPNRRELQSIVAFGDVAIGNPVVNAAFDTNCINGCTVITCSCTSLDYTWTSTTDHNSPTAAWTVRFEFGGVGPLSKVWTRPARAVRGGL